MLAAGEKRFLAVWFRRGTLKDVASLQVPNTCLKGVPVPTESKLPSRSKTRRVVAGSGVVERHRQRAMRLEVKISRQAMKVVLPTNQQIGPWQARAAHLLVLAEKQKATGRHNPSLADEAQTLLEVVEKHRRGLSDEMQTLPSDVAGSTRFDDTARALQSVAVVLERTLAMIQAGVEPGAAATKPAASLRTPADPADPAA